MTAVTEDEGFLEALDLAHQFMYDTEQVQFIYEVTDPFPRGDTRYEVISEREAESVKTNMAWKRTWTVFPDSVR